MSREPAAVGHPVVPVPAVHDVLPGMGLLEPHWAHEASASGPEAVMIATHRGVTAECVGSVAGLTMKVVDAEFGDLLRVHAVWYVVQDDEWLGWVGYLASGESIPLAKAGPGYHLMVRRAP